MMNCAKCGEPNDDHLAFCRKCGHRLSLAASGEPNRGPHAAPARRCAQCGGTHLLQGAVGPSLGVRVFSPGRQDDVPLGPAMVCVDCGGVSLSIAEDARAFLASNVRR
jgi:hypothetical protein